VARSLVCLVYLLWLARTNPFMCSGVGLCPKQLYRSLVAGMARRHGFVPVTNDSFADDVTQLCLFAGYAVRCTRDYGQVSSSPTPVGSTLLRSCGTPTVIGSLSCSSTRAPAEPSLISRKLWEKQYAVCSVQCAMCSVQCAMCNVQCAMCNAQRSVVWCGALECCAMCVFLCLVCRYCVV
jgi:hypothetical protein